MLLRALIVSLSYLCDHIETCRLYCDKWMKRFAASQERSRKVYKEERAAPFIHQVTWALAYNNFARAAYFCEQFFGVNACLRRAVQPNFTFYRERKQKQTNFSPSLSLPLEIFLRYSCSREFVYIQQSQRIGIIALKFQRMQSHFLSDVFAAVAYGAS